MKKMKIIFMVWIIIMFMASFTCSLVYLISQQSLRLGANEAPSQLANETAINLKNGQNAKNAIPNEKIDITNSLNTFVMVYDSTKNLIASSGTVRGSQPLYPSGVLDHVTGNKESRVTWQPDIGLRFASVAIKYEDGYIVAARSLSETEKLIGMIGKLIIYAWLACTIFTGLVLGVCYLVMIKEKVHE